MNLKKALLTITVILAVIAPGFLAVSAAIDNVSLNARAVYALERASSPCATQFLWPTV